VADIFSIGGIYYGYMGIDGLRRPAKTLAWLWENGRFYL
jgi:hypothetical protein